MSDTGGTTVRMTDRDKTQEILTVEVSTDPNFRVVAVFDHDPATLIGESNVRWYLEHPVLGQSNAYVRSGISALNAHVLLAAATARRR